MTSGPTTLVLEAGPSFRVTNLLNGRVCLELEDVDIQQLQLNAPIIVYDKRGLAKRLGVSYRSVDNFMRQARHPLPYTVSMGRPRFLESDVNKWLEEGSSPAAKRVRARLGA